MYRCRMKRLYLILLGVVIMMASGCYFNYGASPFGNFPICRTETTVAVYDSRGMYAVPGCVDYEMVNRADFDFDENEALAAEGGFPYVENNKYFRNQVVMENLNTRVLAYCRGTAAEIEACVSRLEMSCYTRLTEIPYMSAKYDLLKRGTYPTRRWRSGENVPRW